MLQNLIKDGSSNTRPERTLESGLRVLVDWLQVTFIFEGTFVEVADLFGIGKLKFEYLDYGRDTFAEQVVFSNIRIMRKGEFTYRLVLTGQGCREFETLSTLNWLELLGIITTCSNYDFRRIDIAIDDFGKIYDVNRIRTFVKKGLVVTRMQEYTDTTKGNIATGELTMDSFYLGSMNSRLSINFYDKKLERENSAEQLKVTEETWTRTELRCKREYANQTVEMILLYEFDLGKVAFGILNKNVRFIKNNNAANKRKVKSTIWWTNFIGDVEKLKFSLQAPDRTIQKSKDWHFKSVAPSLAAIKASCANAVEFYNYIDELVDNGTERLTPVHNMMIEQEKELRYMQKYNKWAKGKTGENEELNINTESLNRIYELFGTDKNRQIKKTYTVNRTGIVKPYRKVT